MREWDCQASCSKTELCLLVAVSPGAELLVLVFFLLTVTVRSVPDALLAFRNLCKAFASVTHSCILLPSLRLFPPFSHCVQGVGGMLHFSPGSAEGWELMLKVQSAMCCHRVREGKSWNFLMDLVWVRKWKGRCSSASPHSSEGSGG